MVQISFIQTSFSNLVAAFNLGVLACAHAPCAPLPVPLVVHGHYIHGDVILLMGVQARNLDAHRGEHPPDKKRKLNHLHERAFRLRLLSTLSQVLDSNNNDNPKNFFY